MSLRDQLQAIYDQHGQLTPSLLVDEARSENHALHDRFEWDNAVAGEAWRRQQAHEMIRSIKIVYRKGDNLGPERSVRAFHAVRTEVGHVYEPAERIASDPFLTELVRKDMEREWKALKRRYDEFEDFWHLVRASLNDQAA